MEEREVDGLMDYIEGLAEDPGRTDRDRRTTATGRKPAGSGPFASTEKRKELFSKLIQRGVPASLALKIADRARELGNEELLREVAGMKDVPGHIRKVITSVCSEAR
jgi:hypothetical protein